MEIDLKSQLTKTLDTARNALDTRLEQNFEQLNFNLNTLQNLAREAFQGLLQEKYATIVRKLEKGKLLTDDEYNSVRMLIIGRAEYYIKEEQDFETWIEELKRINDNMSILQSGALNTIDELLKLQALVMEAERIVPDITFYLQEKGRVERFLDSTREIDPQEGALLANMITQMMSSQTM